MKNLIQLLIILSSISLFGQAPINDSITNAISICFGDTLNGNTTQATLDPFESSICTYSANSNTVWYEFIGNGKEVEVSLCYSTTFDSYLYILENINGSFSCLDFNDDDCSLQSRKTISTVNNRNYFVAVAGYSNSDFGNYALIVSTDYDTLSLNACDTYLAGNGSTISVDSFFLDYTISNNGCDSFYYVDLTINQTINSTVQINNPSCTGFNTDTLIASSTSPLINKHKWYDSPISGNLLHIGDTFTPSITQTSNFYVAPDAGVNAIVPPVINTSTSLGTGGMWFTAPNSFIITSLFVPADASIPLAPQNIAVVKFDNNMVPPNLSLSTNDFSVEFITQSNPSVGPIEVDIPISAGDVIGILGSRGTTFSSISDSNKYVIINNDTIPVSPLSSPFELITTSPQDLSNNLFSNFVDVIEFEYVNTDICLPLNRQLVTVEVFPEYLDTLTIQTCDSFISPIGDLYTGSSQFYDTLSSINGCDSVIFVDLTLEYSSLDSFIITACDSFISPSGKKFYASTNFLDTLFSPNSGCLLISYYDLTIGYTSIVSITPIVCDSYTSPSGIVRTASAIFSDTISTTLGCDSIINIDLTVNYSFLGPRMLMTCDSFVSAQGVVFYSDTIFNDTLSTSLGCDSILLTDLFIINSTIDSIVVETCDSYVSPNGTVYSNSAIFQDTLVSMYGCDSIIYVDLTINNSITISSTVVECDSYISPLGNVYTSNAIIRDTLTTASGCDSILSISLTINYTSIDSIYPVVCGSYTSPLGNVFTSSSFFTETLTRSNNCDSIIYIFLTVNEVYEDTFNVFECVSYTSALGNTYNSSNTFTELLISSFGCDSMVTINLTIPPIASNTITPVVCDLYTSPLGVSYNTSQNFTEILVAANGCDSVLNINLTVHQSSSDTIEISSCGEYVSAGGNIYNSSGVYSENYVDVFGCDSVIVIDLSFDSINVQVDKDNGLFSSLQFGASYQWIDCLTTLDIPQATNRQFQAPDNGSYMVEISKGTCVDTSECIDLNSLAINSIDLNSFKLFPNPAKDAVKVQFELIEPTSFLEIKISNMLGNSMFYKRIENPNGAVEEQISISTLTPGIYLLELSDGINSITKRLIIN